MNFKREKGFSLIGLLIGLSITAVVFLAVSSLNATSMQSAMLDTLELNILENQRAIYAAIANPIAWQNTLSQNTFFNCIALKTCLNGDFKVVSIYDSSPLPGHLLTGLITGINPQGTACSNFTAAGNALCPVQYQVTATISCNAGFHSPCPVTTTPVIKLTGQLVAGVQIPDQYKVINKTIYAFQESKVGANKGVTSICATGQWNGVGAFSPAAAFDGSTPPIPVLNPVQVAKVMMNTYPSDGINWGLQCQSPYIPVGCSATKGPLTNDPSDTFMTSHPAVPVGCYGVTNNLGDATVSLTCCGSG